MSDIAIKPFPRNHKAEYTVEVPGSKSITNRALLLAALMLVALPACNHTPSQGGNTETERGMP